jgi:hypothetical protein
MLELGLQLVVVGKWVLWAVIIGSLGKQQCLFYYDFQPLALSIVFIE